MSISMHLHITMTITTAIVMITAIMRMAIVKSEILMGSFAMWGGNLWQDVTV